MPTVRTSGAAVPYTVTGSGRDLVLLHGTSGDGSVDLVGASMGTVVAAATAAALPQRVHRAVAARLQPAVATRGDTVIATAREPRALTDLTEAHPGRVITTRVDVTDPASVRSAVDLAVRRAGRIDVAVNTAGYAVLGALEELDPDEIRRQLETNRPSR